MLDISCYKMENPLKSQVSKYHNFWPKTNFDMRFKIICLLLSHFIRYFGVKKVAPDDTKLSGNIQDFRPLIDWNGKTNLTFTNAINITYLMWEFPYSRILIGDSFFYNVLDSFGEYLLIEANFFNLVELLPWNLFSWKEKSTGKYYFIYQTNVWRKT